MISAYLLSLGYRDREVFQVLSSQETGTSLELWREHSVYHVRAHNHDTGRRLYWKSFPTLVAAHRAYRDVRRAELSIIRRRVDRP